MKSGEALKVAKEKYDSVKDIYESTKMDLLMANSTSKERLIE